MTHTHNEAVLRAQQRIEATRRAREYIEARGEAVAELHPHQIAAQLGWCKSMCEADAAIASYLREQWQD